ncbi:hypothetical protein JNJ66_07800 [Candidatus Saccharibacteria bacterium]|nr:hypothetical protein [Candidatus Saccharibacteria bacterium]
MHASLTDHIKKRLSLSGLIGLVLIALVGMLVAGAVQAIQDNFREQIRLDSMAQEVALLELEVETQRFENLYYKTDEYLDLQARELLNKGSPGETLIILPDNGIEDTAHDDDLSVETPTSAEPPLKDRSNVEQWLYFLFGNKNK